MKIVSWNVNGIRAAMKKGFTDFLKVENPDVICLQETKINEQVLFEGYTGYWNHAIKKGYSGTAVLTKIEPLNVSYGFEHDGDASTEGRVITLEFEEFFLVNAYVPNSGRGLPRLDYRTKWDEDFLSYLKMLDKKKPVVLCGDLNVAHKEIDLANPESNYNKTAGYTQKEIDGMNALIAAGFVDTFREFNNEPGNYSWWSYMFNARAKNVGWRIDYFIVSERFMKNVVDSFIRSDVMGSDHCPVGVELR